MKRERNEIVFDIDEISNQIHAKLLIKERGKITVNIISTTIKRG